jgi:hypothetical protein
MKTAAVILGKIAFSYTIQKVASSKEPKICGRGDNFDG